MPEVREFPVVGWTVEYIGFDFQTRLVLYPPEAGSQPDCVVTLESDFNISLRQADAALTIAPGPPFAGAETVLMLHRASVSRFFATSDGSLLIEFGTGERLEAKRDPHYESWNVTGPFTLLCSPHPGPPWSE